MHWLVAAVSLLALSSSASAQCIGRNAINGMPQAAYVVPGPTPGNAFAFTTFLPTGQPTIILGPRYFQVAPIVRAFTDIHECAHTNGVLDEIQANCIALQTMRNNGLPIQDEQVIAMWHVSQGVIGPQYGGTGEVFWSLTLRCAGSR